MAMARSRPSDTHRVPTAKVVPPSLPSLRIERPLLVNRLQDALGRRLTTVVAGPGYGKSSALAAWAAEANAAWYSVTAEDRDVARLALGLTEALRLRVPGIPADLLAAPLGMAGPDAESHPGARAAAAVSILSQALHERLGRDVAIILDDLHELPASSPAMNLVGDLVRQAPGFLHLVIASRDEPPLRVERLRGHGQVLELTAADIAFEAAEVAALLGLAIGPSYESIADAVFELTGGWPAAVRMAIEALRREPVEAHVATLERLRRPGGSIFGYLAEEVIGREPPPVRRLITAVAPLRGFTPELCAALGVEDAHELLPSLDRRGLFLEPDRTRAGWYALTPLVRDYALEARTAADG
ncbi:MAG: tetratricopeptide repeat protein, partial [Candidatus Limnocylindria bacterium]